MCYVLMCYVPLYIMYTYIILYSIQHEWPRSIFDSSPYLTALEEAEIPVIPGKHSDTRIKPLPLANDYGR